MSLGRWIEKREKYTVSYALNQVFSLARRRRDDGFLLMDWGRLSLECGEDGYDVAYSVSEIFLFLLFFFKLIGIGSICPTSRHDSGVI